MQCVCCKCGVPNADGNSPLCLAVIGARAYHCFCCAQPPRMKCIQCNMPRELAPMEAHRPCLGGSLHVFVYVEPWPPFPDHTPLSPLRAMPVADCDEEQLNETATMSPVQSSSAVQDDNHSRDSIIDLAEDEMERRESSPVFEADVKPKFVRKSLWMTLSDIQKSTHCFRCGLVRLKKAGWLAHAQMCAQDPTYRTRKFFIHLHTLSWCNLLVRDVFWDKHSNPENGTCKICRLSRKNNVPLPFQPKPPPRKNEAILEKRRRSRIIKSRKKRRQTITNDTLIHNLGGQNSIRIDGCVSLRM